jgi:hypothetical protein
MAKANGGKKDTEPKVFDVAKPGKSAPSSSSKPIIITNRPLLQDPMVVVDGAAEGETPSGQAAAQPSEPKVTIKPITINVPDDATDSASKEPEAKAPAQPETPTEEVKPQEAASDDNRAKPEPEVKKEAEEPVPAAEEAAETAKPASEDKPSEEAAEEKTEEVVPEQAQNELDAATKEAERLAAEHAAEIEKLAESHEYYLPIETTETRKAKHFIALGAILILLLGAAWVDIALDAGLVQLGGLKPVTHFFKQPVTAAATASTPRAVSKTFTAPAAKLSFRYTQDWQLTSTGTADRDAVTLSPTTPSTSPLGDVSLAFLSLPVTSPASTLTVKDVRYQKLPHKISGNVYLRDLIYTDANGNINLVSSLGDTNTVKVGQTLQTSEQSFTGTDGKSQNFFGISVAQVASGNAKFTTVAAAQAYLHSAQYQQARTILLSTAPQK